MDRHKSSRTIPEGASDQAIELLIGNLERKWEAARRPDSSYDDRSEYTAAAHWGVPRLIAEIRRLQHELQLGNPTRGQ
ncbi:hypothetical protein [Sphingomonas sp. OTU376]|uniref:hypothetical protein n=1 Tax=Sphingomonas sp. OTU376 TaxID=3043863 RepID=UPI00313F0395